MPALKLCVLSSEILPYAKTGGLADVAGALVRNLRLLGHEVHAFMPLYSAVRAAHPELPLDSEVQRVPLAIGPTEYRFSLRTAAYPGTDVAMHFID
jgi:starch synthase